MHHRIFERELVHLERVIAGSPREPFSPTYWRDRVEALRSRPHAPLYHNRIVRLSRLVSELGKCADTPVTG
ncbi:hypothetical protein AAGS40_22740 [Paraburkholderia sp. PREW-6R]|uniref:hypothetical protein n=1 Tax=Paraburkholderia sp. PREW-6R TaxID=3141544 RepID=UPI0031F4FD6C